MDDGRRGADEHPITVADALRYGGAVVRQAGSETARLDAEVLLRHVLGLDRAQLFARLTDRVPAAAAAEFLTLLRRRVAGEPIAYLTGEKEFMGLPLRVGPGVLVPRPETEGLVEWASGRLARRLGPATVVDVGTGSGALALALAADPPAGVSLQVVAGDPSAEGLAWAARNRWALALDRGVALVRGDLTAWLAPGRVDLLLANLPYLSPAQVAANPWLAAEPGLALLGGADGLDLVRRLVADLPRVLAPGGEAGVEVDPAQSATVADLLAAAVPDGTVRLLLDLTGAARHVVVERSARTTTG